MIIAGLSFIVGCNLGTGNPCLKTTMLAAAPVLFMWFIFLHMIPRWVVVGSGWHG